MRRCWIYNPKNRPTFFDILHDYEADMSAAFRDTSFYFNQDVGETASASDDSECDDDDGAADDLETDQLTKPSGGECNNQSSPSTPKCPDRSSAQPSNDSRDHLPGSSRHDNYTKPLSSASSTQPQVTDRLLATSDADDTVLTDVACGGGLPPLGLRNIDDTSSDVSAGIHIEAENARRKGAIRNGHIPYSFMTTAPC